ncbi:MAG: T9SS type A sorting domain-containing protein, partial [Bacteroidia bacterium]|nr:T9SS type A sorting domain-containing protein [Bacteroidia bacterium]
NATIANIRIKDSLSSYLDYNTFQFTGSSHAGQFLLYTSGNLYIYYNSINLPDSATDNVGSQGSFRFKIKLKESLPLGTCIKNSAEINFDFNPPVYTNTVQTDIVQYTSVFGNAGNNSVHLYPNPTSNVLKIDWNQAEFDLIQILDVTGKLVMAKSISPGVKSERVNLSHLDAGIYLLHLKGNEDYKSLRFIKQ